MVTQSTNVCFESIKIPILIWLKKKLDFIFRRKEEDFIVRRFISILSYKLKFCHAREKIQHWGFGATL